MGKAALEGRPGVIAVEKGFKGWREINTVVYDPDRISVEEMETILREAGTYRGTAGKKKP